MSLINEFSNFLKNNNLGTTIVATIISSYITELGISFSDNIILPIIDQDLDGDGKPDIGKLKNLVINVGKCKLKLGEFFITFTKVLLMFIIIFIIQKEVNFVNKTILKI
jgi:large-conductance mechanosensitive channel